MEKNPYEVRNKFIKWFTIIVIVAFLLTMIAGWIVAFLPTNNTEKKQEIINTSNKPLQKENQEVNNYNNAPWQLIQTGNTQK